MRLFESKKSVRLKEAVDIVKLLDYLWKKSNTGDGDEADYSFDLITDIFEKGLGLKPKVAEDIVDAGHKMAEAYKIGRKLSTLSDAEIETNIKKLVGNAPKLQKYLKESQLTERAGAPTMSLPNTNLIFLGAGMDANGNRIAKFQFPNDRAFSFQIGQFKDDHAIEKALRGNPKFEDMEDSEIDMIEKNVVNLIKERGSSKQKAKIKTYSGFKG